jgi:hypothetical protein
MWKGGRSRIRVRVTNLHKLEPGTGETERKTHGGKSTSSTDGDKRN